MLMRGDGCGWEVVLVVLCGLLWMNAGGWFVVGGCKCRCSRGVVKQDVVEVRRDVKGRSEQEDTGEGEEGSGGVV